MSSIRVLHLLDSLRVGGKERQAVELIRGLGRYTDVESMVVTMSEEDFYLPHLQELGVPVHYLIRSVRWDISLFFRFRAVLRRFRPHIIHTNSDMATFYALPLAKVMGIKVVNGCIRNAFSGRGLRWKIHKRLLQSSDARVSNSKAGFASRGLSCTAADNFTIYNGFDLERFEDRKRASADFLRSFCSGKRTIGMIAECSDYKDYATFMRAAKEVRHTRNDVMFVAVGGGKNLPALQRMAESEEAYIKFLGERKDVEGIIGALDVGVLCTFTEGISNSVMECMAAQKPVIVTDGGGSRELVTDGVHGFLVPPADAGALAEKVLRLLDDRGLSEKMGAAGRARVASDFSLEQLAKYNFDMYRSVLHQAHHEPPSVGLAG